MSPYLNFPDALHSLFYKQSTRMFRDGWNGMYVFIISEGTLTHPALDSQYAEAPAYLAIFNELGEVVPWNPSQSDLFATDWQTV